MLEEHSNLLEAIIFPKISTAKLDLGVVNETRYPRIKGGKS